MHSFAVPWVSKLGWDFHPHSSPHPLLRPCQFHRVSDLSPSQHFSLHNFSPCSLSWVPSAISVCYFLEDKQPSKGKYFRAYSSSFSFFASIWYQNSFWKHLSRSWQIFRIIWFSPSALERFCFSLCHPGIGKNLVFFLLNSSCLLWWLSKGLGDNTATRTEGLVIVMSSARILCCVPLCPQVELWLPGKIGFGCDKNTDKRWENLDLLRTQVVESPHELMGIWYKISRPGDEGLWILLVNSLWMLMLLISWGRCCYK